MLRLDWNMVITIVNLIVLCLLLKKFLIGPVTAIMEQRAALIEQQLADAMRRGVNPGSDEANELAEAHRRSLVWFDVTPSMHVCLGRMYVADERFVQHYDALEPGLAQWLLTLIEANATRFGVDLDNVTWQ